MRSDSGWLALFVCSLGLDSTLLSIPYALLIRAGHSPELKPHEVMAWQGVVLFYDGGGGDAAKTAALKEAREGGYAYPTFRVRGAARPSCGSIATHR